MYFHQYKDILLLLVAWYWYSVVIAGNLDDWVSASPPFKGRLLMQRCHLLSDIWSHIKAIIKKSFNGCKLFVSIKVHFITVLKKCFHGPPAFLPGIKVVGGSCKAFLRAILFVKSLPICNWKLGLIHSGVAIENGPNLQNVYKKNMMKNMKTIKLWAWQEIEPTKLWGLPFKAIYPK